LVELLRPAAEALAAEGDPEGQTLPGDRIQRREECLWVLVILPALVPQNKWGLSGRRLGGGQQPGELDANRQHRAPGGDLFDALQLVEVGEMPEESGQRAQQGLLVVTRVEEYPAGR